MEFKEPNPKSADLLHPEVGAPFEAYLPFVKVKDVKLKERFISILRQIFLTTNNMWRPGSCHGTEELKRILEKLNQQGDLSEVNFTAMQWLNTHFYLTAKLKDNEKSLIVDPFGVPPLGVSEGDWMKNARLITPFFGEIELAPPRHKKVYTEATEGTRRYFSI